MSWKSLDDIYIQESAGKQIPSLPRQRIFKEATAQEVIDLIKDLDSQGLLKDGDDLNTVKKFLASKPFTSKIFEYLDSKNLTENTIREGDVRKFILEILANNNDTSKFAKYIENPASLSSIDKSGMLIPTIQKLSGVSAESITGLINLIGTESGRGVGRSEIALATFFKDVKMSETKGDLDWNGNYLEVKGTAARLGKRDRAYSNFEESELGKLAVQFDKSDKRIDTLVANLTNEQEVKPDQVYSALSNFIKISYPHSSIELPENLNLTNSVEVRKAITKIMMNNYAEHEGLESFIFVNTSNSRFFSRYIIFGKDQISDLVDRNIAKAGAIHILDLDPSLGTI